MRVRITEGKLKGTVNAVSSKSDAHRALICAALSDDICEVRLNAVSRDIEATVGALISLGAGVQASSGGLLVTPLDRKRRLFCELDCGESGSTLRFLMPVASALCKRSLFTGGGRLPLRPQLLLTEQLRRHGCAVSADTLPIEISGRLTGGDFLIRGDVSSQYISGLLFALPLVGGGTVKLTAELQSKAYVEMTINTLNRFGIVVEQSEDSFSVDGKQVYRSPLCYETEGDWSSAAFWLTASFLGGGVSVCGLNETSVQADRAVKKTIEGFSKAGEVTVDASEIPDLVPVLSAAACGRKDRTIFTNCARLRLKESNRIKTAVDMVNSLGGNAFEMGDGFVVNGSGSLKGGEVNGANDHRVVMAAAVASAICEGSVIISDAEAVKKSYPSFFNDFLKLGGTADVI